MIIDRSKLEEINGLMIGRGAPDKKDNFGYNIPDYNKLSSIWLGASDSDIYEIASRLLKYYDTQLKNIVDFTKEDLIETIEYYADILKRNIIKPSVTVGFDDKYKIAYIGFKYNEKFINICRNYRYRFDRNLKAWYGDSRFVKNILEDAANNGADVEYSLNFVNYLIEEGCLKPYNEEDDGNIISETDKIEVIELDDEKIALRFDYNPDVINEIKKLKSRNFNWENKTWEIYKYHLKELYDNISYLNIDLRELEKHLNNIPIPKLKVKKVEDYDIEIYFPYEPKIVEKIKKLYFYRFNNDTKSWIIDKREVPLLIESIKETDIEVDITELEGLSEESNNINKVKLRDYSYLRRKPFNHQIEAANFLLEKKKAILADEMGGGKTLSSLLAAYSLPTPRLVICPASLKLNWAKEIRLVDYEGTINVVKDNNGIDKNADWNIINYDVLEKYYNVLSEIQWSVIIYDEAHYLKAVTNGGEPNSQRAAYGIYLGENVDYIFLLTGTPMNNRPKDIFNLLRLCKHLYSRNFFVFAQNFCGATHNGFGWDFNGSSNEGILHEGLKDIMLRRLKKDMLDLPDKMRRFIPVEIDLRKYRETILEYLEKKPYITGDHLVELTTAKHILAKEKVRHTIEIAETIVDSGESVVIFTCYDAVVKEVKNKFKDNVVKITGEDSEKERQQAVDDFQSGKVQVIVANIIAGGVGLTLTRARHLIFNDFDWVPANHFQAEDRIHRIGQNEKVTVNYVYAEGAEIDEYMVNLLESKANTINNVIDGGVGEKFDYDILNYIEKMAAF